jgi:hypothetical protein
MNAEQFKVVAAKVREVVPIDHEFILMVRHGTIDDELHWLITFDQETAANMIASMQAKVDPQVRDYIARVRKSN